MKEMKRRKVENSLRNVLWMKINTSLLLKSKKMRTISSNKPNSTSNYFRDSNKMYYFKLIF